MNNAILGDSSYFLKINSGNKVDISTISISTSISIGNSANFILSSNINSMIANDLSAYSIELLDSNSSFINLNSISNTVEIYEF